MIPFDSWSLRPVLSILLSLQLAFIYVYVCVHVCVGMPTKANYCSDLLESEFTVLSLRPSSFSL